MDFDLPLPRVEAAYRFLSGDDSDERACAAIPEAACTDVPLNYTLNVANGAATKLAEQLASPGLVLPWLAAAMGAPAAVAALFVPARLVGTLLPQLAVAGWVRGLPRRKGVWVGAGLTQAALLAVLALVATWPAPWAPWLMVGLFLAFNVASGTGSVAFQDVMGKTIPSGRRGRLLANRATIGGLLTLAAAALLRAGEGEAAPLQLSLALVLAAALLWAVGAGAFAATSELPGASEGGRTMWREVGAGVTLVRRVPGFRRFLVARGLLLSIEMATPVYAWHAAQLAGGAAPDLLTHVFAVGLAGIVASPLWGRRADASSRKVMATAGACGAAAGGLALLVGWLPWRTPWLYAGVFVLAGVAEAGVRLGRKTYLVDGTPAAERPLYTAFANTAVGVLALAGGGLGVLTDRAGAEGAIALLIALAAAGALASWRLPEAAHMDADSRD